MRALYPMPLRIRKLSRRLSAPFFPFALLVAMGLVARTSAQDLPEAKFGPDDWPWWRGPSRDGKAIGTAPLRWSRSENVLWRTAIPGLGHSSPAVVGQRIFIASSDESFETQSIFCLDRPTGHILWETVGNQGGFEHRHPKNTHASTSPACDGERVFAPFFHHGALHAVALDFEGRVLWKRNLGKFDTMHGYSSSPVVWKSSVIVISDSSAGSFITALNRKTGAELWRTPRRAVHSFATPALGAVSGRAQLVVNAAETVTSYDPDSGRELWLCEGPAHIMACTLALSPDLVFASGGYPEKELFCLRGDGTGDVTKTHIAWRTKKGLTYVPSPVYHDDRLFVVNDSGVATCFEAKAGAEIWKSRLRGDFSASPVLADGRLYIPNEDGETFVLRAADSFELLAKNDLADRGYSTPTIAGSVLYLRTSHYLYAIGERAAPDQRRIWATAHAIPRETTPEESGHFSILEGKDQKIIHVGTATNRENADWVAFDPRSQQMDIAVDALKEIGEAFPDRIDHLGRAYRPAPGGEIDRFDPASGKLERLQQTIDGASRQSQTLPAQPESHPTSWDLSPDRKTLFAAILRGNQLVAYDVTSRGTTLSGRSLGRLLETAATTDCRALCVGPTGTVWAAVTEESTAKGRVLHVVSWRTDEAAPKDHGALIIENPAYTTVADEDGQPYPHPNGTRTLEDGSVAPLYPMGICEAHDGTVYVTAIYPYTLLELHPVPRG